MIKPQISKKDKNLVGLLVLAEFACKSVATLSDKKYKNFPYKKMTKAKEDFYTGIKAMFEELTQKIEEINTAINDDFLRIYGQKELNVMMDSVIGVLELLESQDSERVNEILKATGFKGAEVFFDQKEKAGELIG